MQFVLFIVLHVIGIIIILPSMSSCPTNCRCTYEFKGTVAGCNSERLKGIPTNFSRDTYLIDLSFNSITNVRKMAFAKKSYLVKIDLSHNMISVLETGAFSNLPALTYILSENMISVLETGTFSNLPALTSIKLQQNNLTVINFGIFQNLPNLQKLYLYTNMISVIETGAFRNLPALHDIQLQDNKLKAISSGVFQNMSNLQYLSFHRNEISTIKTGGFWNLPALVWLNLDDNKITKIEKRAFVNMSKLRNLKMNLDCDNCQISSFYKWIKNGPELLHSPICQDFSDATLTSLPESSFVKCNDHKEKEYRTTRVTTVPEKELTTTQHTSPLTDDKEKEYRTTRVTTVPEKELTTTQHTSPLTDHKEKEYKTSRVTTATKEELTTTQHTTTLTEVEGVILTSKLLKAIQTTTGTKKNIHTSDKSQNTDDQRQDIRMLLYAICAVGVLSFGAVVGTFAICIWIKYHRYAPNNPKMTHTPSSVKMSNLNAYVRLQEPKSVPNDVNEIQNNHHQDVKDPHSNPYEMLVNNLNQDDESGPLI